ncbi:MAG: alpha/beta fold hydrolase [Gillisia sp.]
MIKKYFYYFFLLFFIGCNLHAQDLNFSGLPVEVSTSAGNQDELVIYLTGDGGWNNFSSHLMHSFEREGFGVVSVNTRDYFWDKKSPAEFAEAIEKLSKHYLAEWKKDKVILVGYSFGADVASFLPSRLSSFLQKRVKNLVLLSPSASTDFVIRLRDMIGSHDNAEREYKTAPEIENSSLPIICVFGNQEDLILKNVLKQDKHLTIYKIPGDHEYEENYSLLTSFIHKN